MKITVKMVKDALGIGRTQFLALLLIGGKEPHIQKISILQRTFQRCNSHSRNCQSGFNQEKPKKVEEFHGERTTGDWLIIAEGNRRSVGE